MRALIVSGMIAAGGLEILWADMQPRVDESSPRIFGASVTPIPPIDDRNPIVDRLFSTGLSDISVRCEANRRGPVLDDVEIRGAAPLHHAVTVETKTASRSVEPEVEGNQSLDVRHAVFEGLSPRRGTGLGHIGTLRPLRASSPGVAAVEAPVTVDAVDADAIA